MTGLNRAGYYRWRTPPAATPLAMEVRNELQQTALQWPAYGYRRITAELQRRGFDVNHKRVLRLMREDNLLCLRRRSFVVTTDSRHNLPVYPNLAGQDAACRYQSTLDRRHHLHPSARRVRVFGRGAGRILAARDWLGSGPDARG
jgi:transposase InsO family protein